MPSRTDIIAAVLRRPVFRRPIVGHELRGSQVQMLGRNSDLTWTATVPQLAEAIDTALLKSEEKDTPASSQPAGTASTARAEILRALQAYGHTATAARDLLARADHEPRHADPNDPAPDPDFRETVDGGHALVVEYGGCEMHASCQCGTRFGMTTPDASLDTFVPAWEHHTNTEVS